MGGGQLLSILSEVTDGSGEEIEAVAVGDGGEEFVSQGFFKLFEEAWCEEE